MIVAKGYSDRSPTLLKDIMTTLPKWKTLQDPCYSLEEKSEGIQVTSECLKNKIEYGLYDFSN